MSQLRNNPGKRGAKPVGRPGQTDDDRARLADQWQAAWQAVATWEARVKKRGATTTNRFGDRVISPEQAELTKARTHLLAVSKACAAAKVNPATDGSEPEQPGAVLSLLQGRTRLAIHG